MDTTDSQTDAPDRSGLIDWARIDDLRDEIGADDFAEIAALFLSELRDAAADLPLQGGDALAAALHGIRGSALNLGFRAVAEACLAAERGAGDDPAAIPSLCAECEVILTSRFPAIAA